MLDAKTRWNVQQTDQQAAGLAKALEVSERTAHLLCRRGNANLEDARTFLYPDKTIMHDPFLLADVGQAEERITRAISGKEKIAVFGDYDVDGVSSTALMCETLDKLGAIYTWYVPNRFTEGYGPNNAAFQRLYDEGCTLVITVDTGIAAHEPIHYAKEIGLDVIITDHHEVPPELPDAYAILNPKRKDCMYPFKELAGVGVVGKLAHALIGEFPEEGLDLMALGTISDLVPLRDENRYFAKAGLHRLGFLDRPGLQALKDLCGINDPPFSAGDVGFGFGPRLNAAGRMDSADAAVQLLLSVDIEEARTLANSIDGYNRERQETVVQMSEEALAQLQTDGAEEPWAIVVAKKGWNSGVTGIVASRLVEKFYRPAIVISVDDDGNAKGSARSISGFDLYAALSRHRSLFQHFGGHQMAAGLSIKESDIPKLQAVFAEEVQKTVAAEDFVPKTDIELEVNVEDVTLDLIREIGQLEPFGVGNPKPFVVISGTPIRQKRKIGSKKDHLKLLVGEDDTKLECIGFRYGHMSDYVHDEANIHLVGELEINEWKGYEKPQLVIKDAAVTERQLFDVRGWKDFYTLTERSLQVVVFQDKHKKDALTAGFSESDLLFALEGQLTAPTDVFLFDLPVHLSQLEQFLRENEAYIRSVYTGFMEKNSAFFTTKPTREAFKWLYAYIRKYSPLHIHDHKPVISRYQGWSSETIDFMLQVFIELEFVTMQEGKISLNNKPLKQDLQASPTFSNYEEKREIEQTLMLSTYQELKSYLFACMSPEKNRAKVMAHGL
ncbi:single-stranded-DNA-specific exonuclease [Geomicrobium halophilum]|uniref:Single-stranded-DNA-specific exonuclease RecJ n=1 Tax=Geomicrobium halophilum TaxID=549000 RepID=A0A841PT70_9BACL|nr:single-stranded-DNA-specific exonuclease RecJ [Geomicrobium halophilum]MBB6449501.1 single-stranded-DNA-specific exonuclease [Geomicrobium halophilum]